MANIFDEFQDKLAEARAVNYAADFNTVEMLKLIKGRLRTATYGRADWAARNALTDLKRELRDWNMTTGSWN